MKKFIPLSIIVIVSFFGAYGMQVPTTKNFSVCDEIKKLNPKATDQEFLAFAQRLRNNNLTMCDCQQYLSHNKIRKALLPVKSLPNMTEKKYQNFVNAIDEIENRKNIDSTEIYADKSFDPEILHHAKNMWQRLLKIDSSRKEFTMRTAFQDFGNDPEPKEIIYINPYFNANNVVGGNTSARYHHKLLKWDLGVSPKHETTRAIISHELAHVRYGDTLSAPLLKDLLSKNYQKPGWIDWFLGKNKMDQIYKKFMLAHEHRADKNAAVSGSSIEAFNMFQMAILLGSVSGSQRFIKDTVHPSWDKRIASLERIYQIKKFEEQLLEENKVE